MINYEDLKTISVEELNSLIQMAEEEVGRRNKIKLVEAKAKAVIAIRELIEVCKELHVNYLGKVCWECDGCDEENYVDILFEDVLEDIAKVLEGK